MLCAAGVPFAQTLCACLSTAAASCCCTRVRLACFRCTCKSLLAFNIPSISQEGQFSAKDGHGMYVTGQIVTLIRVMNPRCTSCSHQHPHCMLVSMVGEAQQPRHQDNNIVGSLLFAATAQNAEGLQLTFAGCSRAYLLLLCYFYCVGRRRGWTLALQCTSWLVQNQAS